MKKEKGKKNNLKVQELDDDSMSNVSGGMEYFPGEDKRPSLNMPNPFARPIEDMKNPFAKPIEDMKNPFARGSR